AYNVHIAVSKLDRPNATAGGSDRWRFSHRHYGEPGRVGRQKRETAAEMETPDQGIIYLTRGERRQSYLMARFCLFIFAAVAAFARTHSALGGVADAYLNAYFEMFPTRA